MNLSNFTLASTSLTLEVKHSWWISGGDNDKRDEEPTFEIQDLRIQELCHTLLNVGGDDLDADVLKPRDTTISPLHAECRA